MKNPIPPQILSPQKHRYLCNSCGNRFLSEKSSFGYSVLAHMLFRFTKKSDCVVPDSQDKHLGIAEKNTKVSGIKCPACKSGDVVELLICED